MSIRLAKILSYVLHPAIFPILGVFFILKITPFIQSSQIVLLTMALVFCGTYVIPVSASLLMYRLKIVKSLYMVNAKDRKFPYAISAISFYFTAFMIQKIDMLHDAYLFLLASSAVIVMHLLLLNLFKPSAHLAGIGGFLGLTMALSAKYTVNALPIIIVLIILVGLSASARLKLNAHKPKELVFGLLSGFFTIYTVVVLA